MEHEIVGREDRTTNELQPEKRRKDGIKRFVLLSSSCSDFLRALIFFVLGASFVVRGFATTSLAVVGIEFDRGEGDKTEIGVAARVLRSVRLLRMFPRWIAVTHSARPGKCFHEFFEPRKVS